MTARLLLTVLCLVGCSEAAGSDAAIPDGGGGEQEDASREPRPAPPQPPPMDASAPDASVDAGQDAGPVLGRPCDPQTPNACPAITHESGVSEPSRCWSQPSAMYGRCTFVCDRPKKPTGVEPDPNKASLCEGLGGVCEPWRPDGRYICLVK